MKKTRQDGKTEALVLTAMVVDTVALTRIAARWAPEGLFRSKWANLVARWCVDYATTYTKAPGAHIEDIFDGWAQTATDDDVVGLVDDFLGGLSGAYEQEAEEMNSQYVIDVAGDLFNAVLIERTTEKAQAHIRQGDSTKAADLLVNWNKVELGVGAGIDVLTDKEAIRGAFETKTDPLITYPGALGQFFGDQLGRDEFVAVTGATGRGKTWWLIDIAWNGLRQNRRVAFFEVGDMSEAQIMRRFASRATGVPVSFPRGLGGKPYRIEIPESIENQEGGMAEVDYATKSFGKPLDAGLAVRVMSKLARRRKDKLRLSVHPNSSISIHGVAGVLDTWERAGWVPDVVIIDYADILKAPAGFQPGERDAINETWKQMRSLSQDRHCLVVTATQADANSYETDLIRRGNFSDDRRKNDHVTGMLAINARDEEKEGGITRLNWTKRREEAYSESRCVHVAGCLDIGRPAMVSTF